MVRFPPEQVFRCAIVLEPRQPFIEWHDALGSPHYSEVSVDEGESVFLIPGLEDPAETQAYIDAHFDTFFTHVLDAVIARLERLIWIVGAVFVAALVLGRLLPDRSRLRAEATAAGDRADSLEFVLAGEREALQQLRDSAQRMATGHQAAIAAAEQGGRTLEAGIRRARAAAADSALELATARAELERLAGEAERYRWLALGERRAAELRIQPLEDIAARVEVTFTAVEELAAARRDQVEALEGLS